MGPTSVVLHFRPSVNRENGFKLGDQHHVVIIYIYIYNCLFIFVDVHQYFLVLVPYASFIIVLELPYEYIFFLYNFFLWIIQNLNYPQAAVSDGKTIKTSMG